MKVRSSLFLDPFGFDEKEASILKLLVPDRVELFTEKYAEVWGTKEQSSVLKVYGEVARKVKEWGIQINAGHDLNQNNLFDLLDGISEIQEISIGQALIAESLKEGLKTTIEKYLKIIEKFN